MKNKHVKENLEKHLREKYDNKKIFVSYGSLSEYSIFIGTLNDYTPEELELIKSIAKYLKSCCMKNIRLTRGINKGISCDYDIVAELGVHHSMLSTL
jgi:hypothetical protein